MNNANAIQFFNKRKEQQNSEKLGSDFSQYDADFILRHAAAGSSLLDLGSGSGLIINKIYRHFSEITAVEYFEEYSKHIVKDKKITVVNANILNFSPTKKYDVITCFGIMQYFSESEKRIVYHYCHSALGENGILIIKNQFGVFGNVLIEGFSDKLQEVYFSNYPTLAKEESLLREIGFQHFVETDIYPPECNKWRNTHFYVLTASR